ncbi:unnamed protein product, partial [marine sediment metagenome]
ILFSFKLLPNAIVESTSSCLKLVYRFGKFNSVIIRGLNSKNNEHKSRLVFRGLITIFLFLINNVDKDSSFGGL